MHSNSLSTMRSSFSPYTSLSPPSAPFYQGSRLGAFNANSEEWSPHSSVSSSSSWSDYCEVRSDAPTPPPLFPSSRIWNEEEVWQQHELWQHPGQHAGIPSSHSFSSMSSIASTNTLSPLPSPTSSNSSYAASRSSTSSSTRVTEAMLASLSIRYRPPTETRSLGTQGAPLAHSSESRPRRNSLPGATYSFFRDNNETIPVRLAPHTSFSSANTSPQASEPRGVSRATSMPASVPGSKPPGRSLRERGGQTRRIVRGFKRTGGDENRPANPLTRSGREDQTRFEIDLNFVREGRDLRTTLMIKNIPNKYDQRLLQETLNRSFCRKYDFLYLPIDFKNKCNVGYAFINIIDPSEVAQFFESFNDTKWDHFNSEKICKVTYARIQGKQAFIEHFRNSNVMNENDNFRPLIFFSDGPDKGLPERFPAATNTRPPPPHTGIINHNQPQINNNQNISTPPTHLAQPHTHNTQTLSTHHHNHQGNTHNSVNRSSNNAVLMKNMNTRNNSRISQAGSPHPQQ